MGKKRILVISCGGTLEKTYDEGDGVLSNRESVIKERLFKRLRLPHTRIELNLIMAMDSLDMTDEHRQILVDAIDQDQGQSPIVVIHGTDTMDQSASYVMKKIKRPKIPIVFTGSMKPLEMADTDAIQNAIEAIMVASLKEPGVYISFHGKVFQGDKAKKDFKLKTFVDK